MDSSDNPELKYRGPSGSFFNIANYNVRSNGLKKSQELRDRYYSQVKTRDGIYHLKSLDDFFRSNPIQDPGWLASEIESKYILWGFVSDNDGTLMDKRSGYDDDRLYGPSLASAIGRILETIGTFTITTAADYKRALYLLNKGRNQLELSKMIFFCENGAMAMIPAEKPNGDYEFKILGKNLPSYIYDTNRSLMSALDTLSEISMGTGLFMFPNRDKQAKVTLELLSNGQVNHQRILDQIVIPYLSLKFNLGSIGRDLKGNATFNLGKVKYEISVTKDSIEFDHEYLPSKEIVNNVLTSVMCRNVNLKDVDVPKKPAFIGLGDSPFGSDFGITNPNYQNIGVKITPKGYDIDGNETLMEIIKRELKPGVVSLPVFDDNLIPTKVLGAGDAASQYLDLLYQVGDWVSIRDDPGSKSKGFDTYLSELNKVLCMHGFVELEVPVAIPKGMYTFPKYVTDRPDARHLTSNFENSVPDSNIEEKIGKIETVVKSKAWM